MSIRIHAAGSDGFRYEDDALPFQDVYNLASALSVISAGPPPNVAAAAAESQISPGSPTTQATAAVAHMSSMQVFRGGIIALLADIPRPILSITAYQSHLIGADSSERMPESLVRSHDAHSLMRDIDRVLKPVELNTTGALFGLGTVFSRFVSRRPKQTRPARLQVTLSH